MGCISSGGQRNGGSCSRLSSLHDLATRCKLTGNPASEIRAKICQTGVSDLKTEGENDRAERGNDRIITRV
jgi:hypothetical protein